MSTITLRDARAAYFAASGFDERTYTDDWVDIQLGPVPLRFPNTPSRKAIVPLHDLHHALTGYQATLIGEAEIAAWEIGGGIGRHWIGWYLNLLGLSWASVFLPTRTLRAFVRGRRSRNFYGLPFQQSWLDDDVDEVRARLGLRDPTPARLGEIAAFVFWSLVGITVGLLSLVLTLPLMVILGIVGAVRSRGAHKADAAAR